MLQHVGGGITRNFEYDIENRLKTYKHGTSTIATYAYDYSGQRIKKTVSQSGITTRFAGQLYEEDNTGAEYQHVFAGGARVATIAPLGVQFYHGDHLGSRSVVTDSDGLEVDHIDYRPFGEINRHDAVASEEGHHFTDQYRDDETALYYYGARYYNPKIGRFITSDWVVPGPGNPQEFNRYAYTLNNPINRIDPSGNNSLGLYEAGLPVNEFDVDFSAFASIGQDLLFDFSTYRDSVRLIQASGFGSIGDAALSTIGIVGIGSVVADAALNLFSPNKISKVDDVIRSLDSAGGKFSGIERASQGLIDAVSSRRTVQFATEGSDELRYLNSVGAEANVGGQNLTNILLRENPSKLAVLEEFLHGTQARLGVINVGDLNRTAAEIHVNKFMLNHHKLLGLGAEDVDVLNSTLKTLGQ